MKKKKVPLDVFEESVLPMLEQKHTDVATLQKAIDDGYSIYESDDEGKETDIAFRVKGKGKQKAKSDDDEDDNTDGGTETTAMVKRLVAAELKAIQDKAPKRQYGDITVGEPAWMPEGLKLYKSIRSFKGTEAEKKRKAYMWGAFMLAGVMGIPKYIDKCKEMGIPITKAQSEGTNTAGGVLVPEVLDSFIVDLREEYGVYRQNARVAPMTRDVMEFPRRTGGLTASFKDEAAALTESTKSWDSITLTTKKLTALAKMSVELMEDAIINVGDDLAGEIAYAFSNKEDECGFNGDGSTTYGGIHGAAARLKAIVGATTTSAGGIIVATGNLMSEVVIGDLLAVIGILPQYADTGAKWYCHRYFWWNVLERLERAAGGVSLGEQRGGGVRMAFGYPVVISQVFPKTDTNSQIMCLFGDLSKSSTFGDRRQTTISISDQVYWANDQVGIKGTERFDIVNHDLGTATVAGPLVGLQALNS